MVPVDLAVYFILVEVRPYENKMITVG